MAAFPELLATLALLIAPAQADETATPPTALARAETFADLVARDRRIGFALHTAPSAVATLENPDVGDERRAMALMALGCARAANERPRIESYAHEGALELKQAAALALGELGSGAVDTLIDLAGRRSEALAECALVGLARCGSPAALEHVRRVAADTDSSLAATARAALAFRADPASAEECDALRRLLGLRFDAARRHGLVDGQVWRVLVLEDLCADGDFLGRVVYRAAGGLRRPGVRDHFLEVVLSPGPAERLRGAIVAMPTELAELIDNELWEPEGEAEWRALIDEIERRRLAGFADGLVRRAWLVPSLRPRAAELLARSGSEGALGLLEVGAQSSDPEERARSALALGAVHAEDYAPLLAALAADVDPRVSTAALVAQIRMGHPAALATARSKLGLDAPAGEGQGELAADWRELVSALATAAQDVAVRALLLDVSKRLPGAARAEVATALVEVGSSDARALLRDVLRARTPQGEEGVRAIAALARNASLEDIAVLHELFPADTDVDVQVELAVSLVALHDSAAMPVLRAALWSEPWNQSVLAGLLWIEVEGLDGLRLELSHPPAGATPRDRRRVGFALGEWGGLPEVERLSARLSSTDPALQGAVLGALGDRTH